jgi:hypothetical protein
MTVIRLRSGGLVLHSVVALDPPCARSSMRWVGPGGDRAEPSAHHLFASDYRRAIRAPCSSRRRVCREAPDLKFAQELSDEAPGSGAASSEQLVFGGVPLLNEVVFFHPRAGP